MSQDADGPATDAEQPLEQHVEELIRRSLIVIGIISVVLLLVLPFADAIITFLWDAHMPNPTENVPRVYSPLALFLTKLLVATIIGGVVGLPAIVYEAYVFMRPGLYEREERYFLAAVPMSFILAVVGGLFAHFLFIPLLFDYFAGYTMGAADLAFGLSQTFGLILTMFGYMIIIFQIPVLITLAILMGVVSREWLEQKRILFWGGFVGLAFLSSPDPTGAVPFVVGITMVVLFEGTLLVLRWVKPKSRRRET